MKNRVCWIKYVRLLRVYGALAVSTNLTPAQSYGIDWYKISGGGGTSSRGQYTISGAIGQHDAGGSMTGGGYSVTGGFWSLISVVQTPGAPTLYISHTGNTVEVHWQAVSGLTLQQNNDLRTTNWETRSETANNDGTNNVIIVSPPTRNRFYRLFKP